jgi:quinol-cytochrome oxidoreductase complex cytochrome b subunit
VIARKAVSQRRPAAARPRFYPMLALIALVGMFFGPVGRQIADDMPESKTHPYYPDHFWPYPLLAMATLVTVGLLAVVGQPLLHLGQAADPRAAVIPKPEWYFLALFQFAKLGPGLITKMVVPGVLVLGLLLWPLLDHWLGPWLAHRLGWPSWPAPKRNVITATVWFGGLAIVGLLTFWSAFAPELCIPWPYYGPVCGG